ncbi:hypothetical protein [Actinoplanes sp. NPDC051851]|uniref:hypothetical protein n=1 Tax=Actinoplanes sp. NPDC051851 TaxID=3154753 RepID=UPI003424D689
MRAATVVAAAFLAVAVPLTVVTALRPAAPEVAAPVRPTATPAPFVQRFAEQPGVRPLRRRPSPTATLAVPAGVDGCDHSYGVRGQCVPNTYPPGVRDRCAWLRDHGFLATPLRVTGRDRQRLDRDGDGLACDT